VARSLTPAFLLAALPCSCFARRCIFRLAALSFEASRASNRCGLYSRARREAPAKPLAGRVMSLDGSKSGITVHGFRSSFRDWTSEATGFSHEVCEMALALTISNKAEAAYRRGDLFEKRPKFHGSLGRPTAPRQKWRRWCDLLRKQALS
jgi:hypothetical protein